MGSLEAVRNTALYGSAFVDTPVGTVPLAGFKSASIEWEVDGATLAQFVSEYKLEEQQFKVAETEPEFANICGTSCSVSCIDAVAKSHTHQLACSLQACANFKVYDMHVCCELYNTYTCRCAECNVKFSGHR